MSQLAIVNVVTRSSLLMGARVAGAALSFGTSVLIARRFGAEALGIVAMFTALTGIVALFVSAGRQAVAPMFIAQYLVSDQTERIRGFIDDSRAFIAIASLLASSVLSIAALLFDRGFGSSVTWLVLCCCIAAPAAALLNFNGAVLTGYRLQLLGLVPDLLLKPALILLAVLAVALIAPESSPYGLLVGFILAFWAASGAQLYVVRARRILPAGRSDVTQSKRWQGSATPWIAIVLLSDYLVELHLLLAGWFLNPSLVGILHVCFRLRMLASFGLRALYAMVIPDIYAQIARGKAGELARDITRSNALAVGYTCVVSAAVIGYGDRFLALFGQQFVAAYDALVLCCLAMIPRAVFGPATSIMAALGRQKPMIVILLIAVAISAAVIWHTHSELGVTSIAVGYAAAVTFAAALQWSWTLRETGIDCSIFALATYRPRSAISPRIASLPEPL